MNDFLPEIERIKKEYTRRAKEIPADYYSLDNPANLFMISTRKKAVESIVKKNVPSLADCRILDVGCGRGDGLADFISWGASENNLCGIEILPDRIERASQRFPRADLKLGGGAELPWNSETFDIVSQSTVFSSILEPELRSKLASEMLRVLKPGGFILWYDFTVNNPRNRGVRGVTRNEVEKLFSGAGFKFHKITLAPPLTRLLAGFSLKLCGALENLGFLNTHLLAVIRKNK